MPAVCPNCRQPVPDVAEPCAQLGCQTRGYHGVPQEVVGDKVDPRVGLLLGGKYLLVRLLGKGGMGVVMVALQLPLLREVALKVISGVQIDDAMRGRFVREARAVAALDHPNVVKLVDFGVARIDGDDAPFMVMELVSGAEPLRKVFAAWRQERPTWGAFGDVFGQLLAALGAAHERGIVHRDVKPDNAMAKRASGYDWFVQVLDFGLAKSFERGENQAPDMQSLTETGAIVGTPQYMAPEQLSRLHLGPTDHRADLYAVGVMMFEVLTGRRAYLEADTMQLVLAKLDPARDPLQQAPELDAVGPMAQVVRRAMAWAAGERFADAAAFRGELAAAVQASGAANKLPVPAPGVDRDAPTVATPPTTPYGGRRPSASMAQAGDVPGVPQRRPSGSLAGAGQTRTLEPEDAETVAPGRRLPTAWLGLAAVAVAAVGLAGWWAVASAPSQPPIAAPSPVTLLEPDPAAAADPAPPVAPLAVAAPAALPVTPTPAAERPTEVAVEPAANPQEAAAADAPKPAKNPTRPKVRKPAPTATFDKF